MPQDMLCGAELLRFSVDFPEGAKLREHRHSEAIGDAKLRPEGEELS